MTSVKPLKLTMTPTSSTFHELLDQITEYHIPNYQRDYTWREDEVGLFLSDLIAAMNSKTQRFFGPILMADNAPFTDSPENRTIVYVIDGQQRLTTFLIALVALRHLALELSRVLPQSRDVAEQIHLRLTVDSDDGPDRLPRLQANRANAVFMNGLLVSTNPNDVARLYDTVTPKQRQSRCTTLLESYQQTYSELRLLIAHRAGNFNLGSDEIRSLDEILTTHELAKAGAEEIRTVSQYIMKNSVIVRIHIKDWQESFELFDGLNNRGMELAKRDVLKNVMFSRAAKEGQATGLKQIEERWKEFEELLSESQFARFLRHYLLLEHPDITLNGVTRTFITLTGRERTEMTMDNLIRAANHYRTIIQPTAANCSDLAEQRLLENLVVLSAERIRPILLSAMLVGVSKPARNRLFTALENLYFRRSAICQQDNKTLEREVQRIAAEIYKHGTSCIDRMIQRLNALSPSDKVFEQMFNEKSGIPDNVARYLLLKIENYLRGAAGQLPIEAGTLEHILPQSPERHWRRSPKDPAVRALINRLGNLTLLRQQENSRVGNESFRKKKDVYGDEDEGLHINRIVTSASRWSEAEIRRRQKFLGQQAKNVWPLKN